MDRKIPIVITLLISGILGRITLRDILPSTPHIYINLNGITQPIFMMDMFFVVAVVSIISGMLLGRKYAFVVPFLIMFTTDMYYGNNWIFIFTWSGFIMLGFLGYVFKKKIGINRKSMFYSPFVSVVGVILYDLWTNFGSWLGWYSHNIQGLVLCYTLAIPFTLWHLVSTIPIFSISTAFIYLWKKYSNILKNQKEETLQISKSTI